MSSRKIKSTTYRKHRTNTPYSKSKGVLQTVKDWLTPSKWTNPWEEDKNQIDQQLGHGPTRDDIFMDTPSPPRRTKSDTVIPTQDPSTSNNINDHQQIQVTPIAAPFDQNQAHAEAPPISNGVPSTSSIKRYNQQHPIQVSSGTTPSTTGGVSNRGRMLTSTPYISTDGLPMDRHVDTPRPPINTKAAPSSRQQDTTSGMHPSNRPSFSVSTFHTPITNNMTGLSLSRSPFLSPFYSGRTVYGGVSNRNTNLFKKRPKIDTTPLEEPPPHVNQVIKPRPLSRVNQNEPTTSETARKILNTLHSISSPLHDARKLPLRVQSPAKRARLEKPTPSSSSVKSPPPPVAPLTAPAPPTISTVKQPLIPRIATTSVNKPPITIDLTKSPPNDTSSSEGLPMSPPTSPSGVGKIRTKRHLIHYSNKNKGKEIEEQATTLSYLANPVPLVLPKTMTSIPIPKVTPPIKNTSLLCPPPNLITTPPLSSTVPPFAFSSPTPVTSTSLQTTPASRKGDKYAFSAPKIVEDSNASKKDDSTEIKELPPLKTTGSVLDALKLPEYNIENIRKEKQHSSSSGNSTKTKITGATPISSSKTDQSNKITGISSNPPILSTKTDSGLKLPNSGSITLVPSTGMSLGSGTSLGAKISLGSGKSLGTEASFGGGMSIGSGVSLGTGVSLGSGVSPGTGVSLGTGVSHGTGVSLGTGVSISTGTSSKLTLSTSSGINFGTGTKSSLGVSLGTGTTSGSGISLGTNSKQTSTTPLSIPPSSGNWDCEDCYASNPSTKTNCLCCNAPNKKLEPSSKPTPVESTTWECSSCMLINKPDMLTCPACSEKKPGFTTTSGATVLPTPAGSQSSLLSVDSKGGGLKLRGQTSLLAAPSGSQLPSGSSGGLKLGVGGGLKIGGDSNSGLKIGEVAANSGLKSGEGSFGFKIGDSSSGSGLKLGSSEGSKLLLGGQTGLKLGGESTSTTSGQVGKGLSIAAPVPSLGSNVLSLGSNVSSLGSIIPNTSNSLSLSSNIPHLGSNTTTLGSNVLSLGSNVPSLGSNAPSLGSNVLNLGSNVPNLGSNVPSLGSNAPSLVSNVPTLGMPQSQSSSSSAGLKIGSIMMTSSSQGGVGSGGSSSLGINLFGQSNTSQGEPSKPTMGLVNPEAPPTMGRLPTLSPMNTSSKQATPPPGANIPSMKMPALNLLSKMPSGAAPLSGGLSIPKPDLSNQSFSFTAPPKPTPSATTTVQPTVNPPAPTTVPSFSFNPQSNATSSTLSAGIFAIPSTTTNSGQSQPSFFTGSSNLMFGQKTQGTAPSTMPSFPGLGNVFTSSSSSLFNPSATKPPQFSTNSTITGIMGGPSNTMSTSQPQGFNFNPFPSSAPSLNFGANNAAKPQGSMIFGTGEQPSTTSVPPPGAQLFQFGSGNNQTASSSSFQFNPGKATSSKTTSASGRTIIKGRRRLK